MPDWENLVRIQLRGLELESQQQEEIIVELAGHLEEAFQDLSRSGLQYEEAIQLALAEISDWKRLCRRINRASLEEDSVTQRTKSLWIPGFSMVAVMLLGLIGAFRANMYPYGLIVTSDYSLLIYVPWLASLPLIGALGAYWSRRSGGGSSTGLRASLIPVAVLISMFLLSTPVTVFWIFRSVLSVGRQLAYLGSCSLHWVVYPSLLLLFGALPFPRGIKNQPLSPAAIEN
ncbi:MAG TPA: permease prefix domain 1-containing protein [Candidatus Acidoferrales bacterium]|nr:permease prefix domain 1-containing protein [Candidatus Acidoferrales bacterium]